ncbi:leucine rich repeat variant [Actinoplanes sp. SE50]|uniref:leucine rich repeat variant n=1 Tax=unclassified Actinoplanes TaxID=2626549 RepID=UPI00023EC1C9|nr:MULTISPECIES: leucine rich repeat variant [unclassified Actinoplanes]AEV81327.1 leucine rich repeat variant [Actinoplanes sp. SE50/110]ATO79730.1 leucine rich repeat variant [Actinoplanes sp. SE50]SLL97133.1 hypothetical protein ACSP50_0329 [Actinoplanes sp. SE50/110]
MDDLLVALCGNPALPPALVDRLIGLAAENAAATAAATAGKNADVRAMVAGNPATPPETLVVLVANDPPAAVCRVCEQEPIPFRHDPDCLRGDCTLPPGARCTGSHESAVHNLRHRAVDNPSTPAGTVARLAVDPPLALRYALAARPDLPHWAAERLVTDPAPGVRHTLAENPGLAPDLIERLAGDPLAPVRQRLARNPALPLAVLARLTGTTRIGPVLLPRVAAATEAEVRDLAASADPELRMLVAVRRDLPDDVRDALAEDPDAKVVAAVAGHPGLAGAVLGRMVAVHGVRVNCQVAGNPDAPADLLRQLARGIPRVPKALREIARHPNADAATLELCLATVEPSDYRARAIAAGHPALPPGRIAALLADPDPRVAESAAGNPSLPVAAMIRLVSDRERPARP